MRRVVSLWLPAWPTDRLRKQAAPPDGPSDGAPSGGGGPFGDPLAGPLVTATHDGRRRVIAAVDAIAARSGLYLGMPVAQGQALVPDLTVMEARPEEDAAALSRLAAWCLRYAPLTAAAPPDGIWIDVTGSAHLQGGETRLLRDLVSRLLVRGFTARAAVADTPGAAHAMARFGARDIMVVPSGTRGIMEPPGTRDAIVPPGTRAIVMPSSTRGIREPPGTRGIVMPSSTRGIREPPGTRGTTEPPGTREITAPSGGLEDALARLPVAALRLPTETLDGLRLMGIEQIGALAAMPRAPLVRRFGALVTTRLDQAFGRVPEAIEPEFPPELIQARLTFVEPLLTAEAFATVIDRLTGTVCSAMERSGDGARRLDLLFERVDGTTQAIRIGTARASRDTRHLARLLRERLERVEPGLGVEAMRLVVPRTDRLMPVQAAARLMASDTEEPDIAPLIDRLANRLGPERVYRVAPVDSTVPERSIRQVWAHQGDAPQGDAHQRKGGGTGRWPADLPRPVRLLDPPQPVEAMSLLPDHPPMAFTWRRVRHRVRRADGPERIAGEWWKRNGETRSVRDYFRVEDEEGHRYWLFRRGDGENEISGDMRWFLHGLF